ncbi:hypothetical protein [Dactylosporangium sp. CA-139066]|uniref:hypothetical protein n=1 Tax=Dactylosporangium sp. CA-139066 TaxID=3239930 RepID=UPI003D8A746D
MRQGLDGTRCDPTHPFPAPSAMDWIDSREYGARERRPGSNGMLDVDTTPTWRMMAANIWEAPCLDAHRAEVASDPYLTTHLIAASVIVGLPRQPMIYALALEQVGAAPAINALQAEGLEAACAVVQGMGLVDRTRTVAECAALVLHGWVTLRLDIHDGILVGRKIARGN